MKEAGLDAKREKTKGIVHISFLFFQYYLYYFLYYYYIIFFQYLLSVFLVIRMNFEKTFTLTVWFGIWIEPVGRFVTK